MTQHRNTIYRIGSVITIGFIIFLLDYFELSSPVLNEVLLFLISLAKSAYFIWYVFRNIKASVKHEFRFSEFMTFIVLNIVFIVVSFAIDLFCLYKIKETAFTGLHPGIGLAGELVTFFYYSVSVFTTAGFGDIAPATASAQLLVSFELMIAFFFTIFIIANITNLRDSFGDRDRPDDAS